MKWSELNLPNKLTLIRVILVIPFVLLLLVTPPPKAFPYLALILFIIASLTDMFDGMIARKYNLITNFGKFMDPLADKLLVMSALVCLTALGRFPAWITILIMSREFMISGFRLIAADRQIVIAASIWGKIKTVVQIAMILLLLLMYALENTSGSVKAGAFYHTLDLVTKIVILICVILTFVSLVDYIYKNRSVLNGDL